MSTELEKTLPSWIARKGKKLEIDIFAMEVAEDLPHWLHGTKFDQPAKDPECDSLGPSPSSSPQQVRRPRNRP